LIEEVKNQKSKAKNLTSKRLWTFRIIALIAAPVLTLLLLEVVLRLVGYGYPIAAMIPCRIDGEAAYSDNFRFAWRFFPPTMARQANAFVFPASKPPNACRIFVLGSSAAAGTPDGSYSFGRILEVMLRRQYPQTDFEVITVAMPAINSHVTRLIAQDCARHQPDLFVVYMGHNEVVGPYGAGTVFGSLRSSLTLIRLGITVKATRVGQFMTTVLHATGAGGAPQAWQGMQMFLGHQVAADDPRLQTVYHHFQSNLEDIRRLAQKNGIPIVLCTVASNLKDNPPFASQHHSGLTDARKEQWKKFYDQGIAAEAVSDWGSAIGDYLNASGVDDRYADLQFRLGRCYWQSGQFEKAKDSFVLARELDTLRFRADNRINEIIRQVAQQPPTEGVQLLDAVKLFEESSPHATPGEELFHEHVHMTFSGNYLLAKAVLGRIADFVLRISDSRRGANPQSEITNPQSTPAVPTEAQCAQDLAYTAWDQHRLTEEVLNAYIKQPPFTNQIDHVQRVASLEQRIGALKAALSPQALSEVDTQYRQAIERRPADWYLHWNYGQFLERTGKSRDAAQQYQQVCRLVPQRYETIAKLGELSGETGDLETAIARNREALRINPLYADAWFNTGLAYHMQNKLAPSIDCYSKAIRCQPDHIQAYINLGVVLHDDGKTAQAIEVYRKALIVAPTDVDLHCNLALLLADQGRRQDALQELSTAQKLDPNAPAVRKARQAIK
jgi:tetratricopeptide (TPR) repeat protein